MKRDEDGLPEGFATWYNRKFARQHVNTARDHWCEEAWAEGWRKGALSMAERALDTPMLTTGDERRLDFVLAQRSVPEYDSSDNRYRLSARVNGWQRIVGLGATPRDAIDDAIKQYDNLKEH